MVCIPKAWPFWGFAWSPEVPTEASPLELGGNCSVAQLCPCLASRSPPTVAPSAGLCWRPPCTHAAWPSRGLTGAPMQVYCGLWLVVRNVHLVFVPVADTAPEAFGASCDYSSQCVFCYFNGRRWEPLKDGLRSPEEPTMWLEGRNCQSHYLKSEEGREAESVTNGLRFHQSHLCNEASIRSQWTGFGKLPDWWTRCIHLLLGEAPNSTGTKATVCGTSP